MKVLITGGAGFIGSHFVRHLLRRLPDVAVTVVDKLTYAGNLDNLQDVAGHPRYRFIKGDITDGDLMDAVFSEGVTAVVHFAAESHVDRSILEAGAFVRTNVLGTQILLDAVRKHGVQRFIQVSTDEVYGAAPPGVAYREDTPLNPSSPYAASKAAADLLCLAYARTHRLPIVITRCTNNYGPYQFPEKFIPLAITNAFEGQPVPIYGDGMQERDWLFVEDHCAALLAVLQHKDPGPVLNIASGSTVANRTVAEMICRLAGAPTTLLTLVTDRPAHDRRYALDASRMAEHVGWRPETSLERGLAATVGWFRANRRWWEPARAGDFRRHYAAWYEGTLRGTT
jgi:dTDP-glucose 4,6-dehydratase